MIIYCFGRHMVLFRMQDKGMFAIWTGSSLQRTLQVPTASGLCCFTSKLYEMIDLSQRLFHAIDIYLGTHKAQGLCFWEAWKLERDLKEQRSEVTGMLRGHRNDLARSLLKFSYNQIKMPLQPQVAISATSQAIMKAGWQSLPETLLLYQAAGSGSINPHLIDKNNGLLTLLRNKQADLQSHHKSVFLTY